MVVILHPVCGRLPSVNKPMIRTKYSMKKLVLALSVLFSLSVTSAFAIGEAGVKLGYINSQELLSIMPEMSKADADLKAFGKQYQDQLEAMGKEFEKKGTEYQTGSKTMSDAVRTVKEKELQDLEGRIREFQQTSQEKIKKKQEELYKPILEKADKAIKDVAKEKGYDYIFDSASGSSILYAKDSDNILPIVKVKLGLK